MKLSAFAFVGSVAAAPSYSSWIPSWSSKVQPIAPALKSIFSQGGPVTPQILQTFLQPNEVNFARNSYIYREGTTLRLLGEHWTASGANVYWLGLDENVTPAPGAPYYAPLKASYPTHGRITEIMNTLVTMGAKLIRSQTIGVSVGNPLSVMPTKGVINQAAFDSIDYSVFQARQHGLRIIAPLVDDYDYYHGGKFTFLRWAGFNLSGSDQPLKPDTLQFYTNRTVINIFKDYIQKLVTHVNPYTGLTYAQDPTIIGYETGNELHGIIWGDENVPVAWTREICQFLKKLGPQKLCIDGTYGINHTHFAVDEVDIFSDHFYPLNTTRLQQGIAAVEGAGRVYLAAEIDWTGLNGKGTLTGSLLEDFYAVVEAKQKTAKPTVAGTIFWSLFGRDVPDCSTYVPHSDGFTMHYGDPDNTPFTNEQIGKTRKHFFAMQNVQVDSSYLPSVACPQNFIPGYEAEYTYV